MELMNQQLDSNNIVGISYLLSFLKNSHDYYKLSGHASTVVGRNYNEKTGDCEYLIRNSWGPGCASYDALFACHDGHILVPEFALQRGLNGVGYLKIPEKVKSKNQNSTTAQ
jgi:hypothetical protein